jgi:L-rhamnose isomerase
MNDHTDASPRDPQFIADCNAPLRAPLQTDYETLGAQLAGAASRLGASHGPSDSLHVAIPSWRVGTGGTDVLSQLVVYRKIV